MNALGGGQAGQPSNQQQHSSQPQAAQAMSGPGANAGGQNGIPQMPNMNVAMQNPLQLLQVISAQINNLQRQWQTVQSQPETPQKMEATQHLASQMKRMKFFQAQTMQALQNRQQGQQDTQQNQAQGFPHAAQLQQNSQATAPPSSGPPSQANAMQQGQQQGQPSNSSTEPPSPAHNAQLAALQAFAQQQRIQAQQHNDSSTQGWQGSEQQQVAPGQQAQLPRASSSLPNQTQSDASQNAAQHTNGSNPPQLAPPPAAKGDLVAAVHAFMAHRGTPFPPNMPTVFVGPASGSTAGETKSIDMQTLFATVIQFGGSARISAQQNGWAIVASKLGLAVAPSPPVHQTGQPEKDGNGISLAPFVASHLAQFFRDRFTTFEEFWLAKVKGSGQPNSQSQQRVANETPQGGNQPSSHNGMPGHAPQQASGSSQQHTGQLQQAPGPHPSGPAPQSGASSIQDAFKRAQDLHGQLPQQLQQLQEFIKTGKITQDQARERYVHLQNQAKMAMMHAQAQAQAPQNQAQHAVGGMGPPPHQSSVDTKKAPPTKRARKSTSSSMGKPDIKQNELSAPSPSPGTHPSLPGTSTPNAAHINSQAQQAMRLLHQGILNPTQQFNAFTAIRTAQLQLQGIFNVDVSAASQSASQVYAKLLAQAQSNGQPLQMAAPMAFAVAQQEIAKAQPGQQVSQSSAQGPAGMNHSASSALAAHQSNQITNSAGSAQPPTGDPPKFKVEYMPVRRDVRTFGGWDLDMIDAQLGPILAGRSRFPRSVREMGFVDIEGLIMSLKSRLEVEVTYALNALFVLSAGVQAPGFHLLLGLCEDLCDELLDLLEETAFDVSLTKDGYEIDVSQHIAAQHVELPPNTLSHAEWIAGVLEDEEQNRSLPTRGGKRRCVSRSEEGSVEKKGGSQYFHALADEREQIRKAQIALSVLDNLRNLSMIPDNFAYLNNMPRFFEILMRIITVLELEEADRRRRKAEQGTNTEPTVEPNGFVGHPEDNEDVLTTVFTPSEAVRIRKDVLSILASLAKESCMLSKMDTKTVLTLIAFLKSFITDAGETESLCGTTFQEVLVGFPPHPTVQPVARKVPQHADMALEAFSSIAQPDENRKLLSEILEDDQLVELGVGLIKLLPVSDTDFQMLKTEARLGYCERIAMSLFDIAYMGNASVKHRLKSAPGIKGVMFRCIKRLMRVHPDFNHNPFSVLTRRLVEALRVLSDGDNMFDRPPLLGFGMETNATTVRPSKTDAAQETENRAMHGNLLVTDEAAIVELMALEGVDPAVLAELEQML